MSKCALGVGLLEQRGPELVVLDRVHVDELPVAGGQAVVDDHVGPRAVVPEAEVEDARVHVAVLLDEVLVARRHALEQLRVDREARHRREQPAVACTHDHDMHVQTHSPSPSLSPSTGLHTRLQCNAIYSTLLCSTVAVAPSTACMPSSKAAAARAR